MQYLPYCHGAPSYQAIRTVTLKSLRIAAGLSQHELGKRLAKVVDDAAETSYYQPRISAYENGRNAMPLPVAMALVKILNKALAKAGAKERASIEDMAPEKKKPR